MTTHRPHESLRIRARRTLGAVAFLALAMVTAACSDGDGSTAIAMGGGVQVRLTDAPSDYVAEAHVWISRVYLQQDDDVGDDGGDDGGESEGRFDLFFDPDNPREYDLMLLRDGVEADLAEAEAIPEGAWRQLRLVVDSAVVVLAEGYTFQDGGTEAVLKIPSGSSSGIKVQLTEPVEPEDGETLFLLVDFDVNENFRVTGPPPETNDGVVRGMLFTPVLRETRRQVVDEG